MRPKPVPPLRIRVDLESNGNEKELHIPQSSRTGSSPSDAV